MKLQESELFTVIGGGFSFNATMINAFARAISTVLDLGRTVGSAIRRIYSKNYC